MEIDIFDETESVQKEHTELVHSLISFAGEYLKLAPDTELSITFVDNNRIQEINRE